MFSDLVITEITRIFNVFSKKGRAENIKNRAQYGLSFCKEGQITYTHNGNKVISDKNHAVILPQNQSYSLYGDKTGSFPVIDFTCEKELCNTIISIPIENADVYVKDFKQLQSLFLFDGNRMEIMSVFYHILHRMVSQSNKYKVIMPAVKYLEKNYANPDLTNTELAAQSNISEVYFRRVFAKQYGMTPKQFLIDIRINHAKQLLSEGRLKINAVAEKCGFTNQYHFCRVFKEKTGLTPTDYMKQNRIYKI